MSVSLNPNASLGFNRPLTVLIKRTLTITNHDFLPVAFKVKTTAPKLYCVRPNAGRIEPGQSVGVTVQLQPMKEEPPPHVKSRDKFLVQSTTITSYKESMTVAEIWNSVNGNSGKIYEKKIKVVYLPPEEIMVNPSHRTVPSVGSPQYEKVHQQSSGVNGHASSLPIPTFEPTAHCTPPPDYVASLHVDDSFFVAHEERSRIQERHETRITPSPSPVSVVNINVNTPPAARPLAARLPSPLECSFVPSDNVSNGSVRAQDNDLIAKLAEAQNEIQRLQALLAATPDPAEISREPRHCRLTKPVRERRVPPARLEQNALSGKQPHVKKVFPFRKWGSLLCWSS